MRYNHNSPNSFGEEGVDHINISGAALTPLGKVLDPSYRKQLIYPHIGKFGSVLNLWHWLKSDPLDDTLRKLAGRKLRDYLRENKGYARHVPNFKAIIATATYHKLKDYPLLLAELRDLSPETEFLSYYSPNGSAVRMCSSYATVVNEIAKVIKAELEKGHEPDFSILRTPCHNSGLYYLEPFLVSNLGTDKVQALLTT